MGFWDGTWVAKSNQNKPSSKAPARPRLSEVADELLLTPGFTDCVKTPGSHFPNAKKWAPNPSVLKKTPHIESVEVGFLQAQSAGEFSHSL